MRKMVILAAAMMLAACASSPKQAGSAAALAGPDARTVNGLIVSLRPTTSTMLVSKTLKPGDPLPAFPDFVYVKYDAQTALFLDGNPATLDQLAQYMPVHVEGRMQDGAFVASRAEFSSQLPANVKPAETGK